MKTPQIRETIFPLVARLELLQLQSYQLRHLPNDPCHQEATKLLAELIDILKNIPAYQFPLHYGNLFHPLQNA